MNHRTHANDKKFKRSQNIDAGRSSETNRSYPSSSAAPSDDLMRRFKIGDPAAFEELMTAYQHEVVLYARAILGNQEDALEVSQEVFMRVYTSRDRFEIGREFRPWLITITRNFCLSVMKRRKLVGFTPLLREDGSCVDGVEDSASKDSLNPYMSAAEEERWQLLDSALKRLSSADRKLIELRYIQGFSATETAERLGLSSGATRTRACRIIKKLKEIVATQVNETTKAPKFIAAIKIDLSEIPQTVLSE